MCMVSMSPVFLGMFGDVATACIMVGSVQLMRRLVAS